jgi:hypothetical protein
VLQGHQIFAGLQGIKQGLLGFQLFLGIIGGLHGEPDAAVGLVDLDDAGRDRLADLEDILDFLDAFLADLADVHEAVDVVGQADEGTEAGQFGDLAGDEIAHFVKLVDVLQGSSESCLMPTAMRWLALSISSTWASTSSPFFSTSLG